MTGSNLHHYFGDLHSHCDVGYGHGPIEDALANARLQLDFVAVTPHAHWHDMPVDDARLAPVVAYHRRGFAAAAEKWEHFCRQVADNHEPGSFVTFPAFEWHSCRYGDHNIYYRDDQAEIIRAQDLPELRQELRHLARAGHPAMAIPHHIGYLHGYRGIAWEHYDPEFSPVVEAMSMHGAAESTEGPYPYLHTMGPRTRTSTYQHGLELGHVVGIIGSTDHHSAHPGSYGHGRLAVLATELTREAVWDAIWARRTYALTGANIRLWFSVDDAVIGDVTTTGPTRHLVADVEATSPIDQIEILHNNHVIECVTPRSAPPGNDEPFRIGIEVGWGDRGVDVDWDVSLRVRDGRLLDVEPRFRGDEIVAPQDDIDDVFSFSSWKRSEDGVDFHTRTRGNPTTTTPATQGVGIILTGDDTTVLAATVNGQEISYRLSDLRAGTTSYYLGGFLTPAVSISRAVPESQYHHTIQIDHDDPGPGRDWYHVRVRQVDGQCAWSSPIWVHPAR